MLLKNAFRLFVNNVNVAFKTAVFRLVVTVISVLAAYFVCAGSLRVVTESTQFAAFIADIRGVLESIATGSFSKTDGVKDSFTALLLLVKDNASSIRLALFIVLLILFARGYLLGICDYATCVVVDGYMSTISRLPLMTSMLATIKRSLVFEVLYSLAKAIVTALSLTIALLFVVFTFEFISFLSVVAGIWLVILAFALFFSFTATVRPSVVAGRKINEAFNFKNDKKTCLSVFASYVFSVVIALAVNVGMLYTTFGAGLFISLPATSLYFTCLQSVVFYSVDGKKYFIDYDNIVTPKALRKADDRLLEDVDL